jgi:hypothetical protein
MSGAYSDLVKIPIFNNHTSTGPYTSNIVPEYESWKSHVLFGIIGSIYNYYIYHVSNIPNYNRLN